jgi:EpsI family protein
MIARRDLIIGASCLFGAGAAYVMTPRRHMSLLGHGKLDGLVPRAFGPWASRNVADLVAPKEENSLAAKLYDETIERVYDRATGAPGGGDEVMMLMAHGDTQDNELQLHRPEVCYPAFGYEVSNSAPIALRIADGVTLPARRLTATLPDRKEHIIYWSRLGEYLPTDGRQQRFFRLKTAIDGYVADGVLARFSTIGDDAGRAMAVLESFIPAMLQAVPAPGRSALIGTEHARALAGVVRA